MIFHNIINYKLKILISKLIVSNILNPFLYNSYMLLFNFKKLILMFLILTYVFNCSTTQKKESTEIKFKFSVVGDVMIHSTQLDTAYNKHCKCWSFSKSFSRIQPLLAESDYSIANLETTLPGIISEYSGYPTFGSPDSLLDALKESGFSILTTSNNHCLDKGKKTLIRTIDEIKKRGLQSTGTFRSEEEWKKNRFLILEKKGWKIALLSYTYGTNGIAVPKGVIVNLIKKEKIAEDIALAKNQGMDTIIVYYHFGNEYERSPNPIQRDLVNFTFWEGADVVIGGHPHVLQPYELKSSLDKYGITKKRLVMFSLGNFISSQYWRYSNGGVIFYFTLIKNNGIQTIGEIDYEPVFVYREKTPTSIDFVLIPTKKWIEQLSFPNMKPEIKKMMDEFHRDTVELFTKSSYVEE
jgi:poly-gamma-glutamate capsule biosynthesis protein CapA/YwtB (metallophosphatase superfamily)